MDLALWFQATNFLGKRCNIFALSEQLISSPNILIHPSSPSHSLSAIEIHLGQLLLYLTLQLTCVIPLYVRSFLAYFSLFHE